VALNAGAALFIAGEAASLKDGMRLAGDALDRKAGQRTLQRLIEVSTSDASIAETKA
jgi:anthranilate phosphoribosyltransferase